jgi:hypothetical protein
VAAAEQPRVNVATALARAEQVAGRVPEVRSLVDGRDHRQLIRACAAAAAIAARVSTAASRTSR